MAVSLEEVIEDYSPPNGQSGVPLRSTIDIQFTCLMDTKSIEEAFYVEGPDTDTVLGPDSKADIWPSAFGTSLGQEADFLTSPGYKGILQGSFQFSTVDDKTKMVFTSAQPLAAITNFTAHVTDCYQRSVGDTIAGGGNSGNGEVVFAGMWSEGTNTINMRVTKSGIAGIAEFVWWLDSDPINVHGPILTTRRESVVLDADLYADFADGTFETDDEFSADLSTAVLCSGHLTFSFQTGSGSIEVLPTETSSSILSILRQSEVGSSSPLRIVRTIPTDHAAQVDPDLREIVVEFNKTLDPTSISDAMVQVVTEVASSHPAASAFAQGTLAKRVTVDGRRLIIHI